VNISEAIKIALASLWANKLRSILTLLGVVISVGSLITVMTLVDGIQKYFAEKVFNLGADVFLVTKISPVITDANQLLEGLKRKDLTMEDYQAVLETCRGCTALGATASNFNGHVKYGEQQVTDVRIRGATPSMLRLLDLDLESGRFITEADLNSAAQVAVVGADITENLLGGGDPIGKEIRIEGRVYTVVGVGKKQGKTLGQSQDNYAMIPISAFLRQYGTHQSIAIVGKANGIGEALDRAMDEVRVVMRGRRHDLPGKPDSFAIETNGSLMGLWTSLTGTFFTAMIGMAAISLVIGGIVIMNIMLVSVTERTREIGVRKALGARRADVLRQFLIESTTISGVGGIFGVILGVGISNVVTLLIGLPNAVLLWTVVVGLLLATSVGIFFGVYPARRAASLDPIVALRAEL
jgi:putative ABC transport system permease protein